MYEYIWSEVMYRVVAANLRAGIHSVNPLCWGSHLRVPAHHHTNQMSVPFQHHLSDSQKHIWRPGAAHCLGGCRYEEKEEYSVSQNVLCSFHCCQTEARGYLLSYRGMTDIYCLFRGKIITIL